MKTRINKGTGYNRFARTGLTLFGVGGGGYRSDTTYLMNITDKLSMTLKFELTQKHLAGKKESALLDKQEE